MESVLISIRPEWCAKIASGEKTIEIRKTKPKLEPPFKVFIYCTNKKPYLVWGDVFRGNWETEFTRLYGYNRKEAEKIWDIFNGNVMGEFVCDTVVPIEVLENKSIRHWMYYNLEKSCVDYEALADYIGSNKTGYGWHISNLEVYDTPKDLNKFKVRRASEDRSYTKRLERAPQSWCYVEVE